MDADAHGEELLDALDEAALREAAARALVARTEAAREAVRAPPAWCEIRLLTQGTLRKVFGVLSAAGCCGSLRIKLLTQR